MLFSFEIFSDLSFIQSNYIHTCRYLRVASTWSTYSFDCTYNLLTHEWVYIFEKVLDYNFLVRNNNVHTRQGGWQRCSLSSQQSIAGRQYAYGLCVQAWNHGMCAQQTVCNLLFNERCSAIPHSPNTVKHSKKKQRQPQPITKKSKVWNCIRPTN